MWESVQTDLNILLRFLVALVLAGLLGWEREAAGKAAGVRTHMLVGVGATMFLTIGELIVLEFREHGQLMRFDPIRVVEAVVAGISFLGAGTIFVSRHAGMVVGLTTAASIWVTSGIGLLVGLERYALALGATLLMLMVLRMVQWLEPKRRPAGDAA